MKQITTETLTKEITLIIKDEITATYIEEERGLQIQFLNGQRFKIQVQELE